MALLGKFGASGAVDKIVSLGDLESKKAESALSKLESDPQEATSRVLELLRSGQKVHQRILLQLLERLLDNDTIHTVMSALGPMEDVSRNEIVSILAKNKSFDPHLMLPYLKPPLPLKLSRDLIKAHRQDFNSLNLLRMVGKSDPELWEVLFELIHAKADERALAEAVAISHSKNPAMRTHATQLIAEFSGPVAMDALQHLAFDPEPAVRQQAIIGLTRNKADIPAVDLVRILKSARTEDLEFIRTLLKNCTDPHLGKHIVSILLSKDEQRIKTVMSVLKDIVSETIIRDILQGLEGKDPWVREDVIQELAKSGGDQYLAAVGKLAKDDDESVRNLAIEAMEKGDLSNPEVLAVLREALNSSDVLARSNAIRKLGEAKDTASIDRLVALMKADPTTTTSVLDALASIGDPRVLPDVFDLLNTNEIQVQRAALECLPSILTEKYAPGVRDQLIAHADKLHIAIGETLVNTLENLTTQYNLPRDSGYTSALKNLMSGLSEDKEALAPPEEKSLPATDPITSLAEEMLLNDRYKLIREIGRGGYGSVWLVHDTVIDEDMVMKFLHEQLVSDGIAVERFIRELRFARKVTHQNIIRLHDYLNLGNVSAISMEYFDGEPLNREIHKGPMTNERTISIIRMVCDALAAAHEVDVIHRDLKPANILVGKDGMVKIVDFGIAAASKQAEAKLTRTGTLVGTPTYISPEQIQGKAIDARTDIYSLGIIMYEMLTGSPPYVAEDPMALVFMHVEGNARRIDEVNPLVPPDFAEIIHGCIKPSPDDRIPSMKTLLDAINKVEID